MRKIPDNTLLDEQCGQNVRSTPPCSLAFGNFQNGQQQKRIRVERLGHCES